MTKFLEFTIKNVEPIKIAKFSDSQEFQYETLKYIPGSTLRGVIINKFSKKYNEKFLELKKILLSNKVRFFNAYPSIKNNFSVPSPKGFYENKTADNKLKNILMDNTDIKDGEKRAKLGNFSLIDDKVIYKNIETEENLNIDVNNINIFRSQSISPFQEFKSFIAFDDISDDIINDIVDLLDENIKVGSAKNKGYGKCEIYNINISNSSPYNKYRLTTEHKDKYLYLFLLSHTAMLNNNGENCGLDLDYLKNYLSLEDLTIATCSTSIIEVNGINHTWKSRIPNVKMYEAGSVFKLKYNGNLDFQKINELQNLGIGIRKNEGFGQIIFLNNYENLSEKEEFTKEKANNFNVSKLTNEENDVLMIIAKSLYKDYIQRASERYILNNKDNFKNKFSKLSESQKGVIMSLITMLKYDTKNAKNSINKFFEDKNEKNEHIKFKYADVIKYISEIIEPSFELEKILDEEFKQKKSIINIPKKDILSEDEITFIKLDLLEREIKFNNRSKG